MNRTVPTANLAETEAEKNKRRRRGAKVRPIDKGTVYDVTGKMRRLIHEIESGKHGEVTDVVLAMRCSQDGKTHIKTITIGTSVPEVLHYMAAKMQSEFFQ